MAQTAVKPGRLRSMRRAYAASFPTESSQKPARPSRSRSRASSASPSSSRAWRRASEPSAPASTFSATASSRWCASSSRASRSSRSPCHSSFHRRHSLFTMRDPSLRRLQDSGHRRGYALPVLLLRGQAAPPVRGDAVIARATVVVGGFPFRVDQAVPLEPLEGGVERPQGDAEDALRALLDALPDAVAVQGCEGEGLEDQEVQLLGGHQQSPIDVDRSLLRWTSPVQGWPGSRGRDQGAPSTMTTSRRSSFGVRRSARRRSLAGGRVDHDRDVCLMLEISPKLLFEIRIRGSDDDVGHLAVLSQPRVYAEDAQQKAGQGTHRDGNGNGLWDGRSSAGSVPGPRSARRERAAACKRCASGRLFSPRRIAASMDGRLRATRESLNRSSSALTTVEALFPRVVPALWLCCWRRRKASDSVRVSRLMSTLLARSTRARVSSPSFRLLTSRRMISNSRKRANASSMTRLSWSLSTGVTRQAMAPASRARRTRSAAS